ncbi:MAG: glutaredoxin 3 [Gammaproteobacteria bacterium]|nr:glutaredoxin 3 [Gammaproteobacteria bacterium]
MSDSLRVNDLNNREAEISSVKVDVYSTALCPYCTMAKSLLKKKGVPYIEMRIDKNTLLRREMERRSNRTSVPQIFIADEHIGGFDDLVALDLDNRLDEILGLTEKKVG